MPPRETRCEDESARAILWTDEMMLRIYCRAMGATLSCRWLSKANWNAIVITAFELAQVPFPEPPPILLRGVPTSSVDARSNVQFGLDVSWDMQGKRVEFFDSSSWIAISSWVRSTYKRRIDWNDAETRRQQWRIITERCIYRCKDKLWTSAYSVLVYPIVHLPIQSEHKFYKGNRNVFPKVQLVNMIKFYESGYLIQVHSEINLDYLSVKMAVTSYLQEEQIAMHECILIVTSIS